MKRALPVAGIVTVALYFAAVAAFLLTQTAFALTVWELLTIFSATLIFVLLQYTLDAAVLDKGARERTLVAMGCACALTAVAHFVDLAVTRPLMAQGVQVAPYWQIGMWPSVEMTIDYLAWGFFTGLAYLSAGLGVSGKDAKLHPIRVTLLVNGCLCLAGFAGVWLNENLWYIAPIGYGIGTLVLCIWLLRLPGKAQPERK